MSSNRRLSWMAGWLLWVAAPWACAAVPAGHAQQQAPAVLLKRADSIKTVDHTRFVRLLDQLDRESTRLSTAQAWHLQYLKAWEANYTGDYRRATELAVAVMDGAEDVTLRARAGATYINVSGYARRYDEAYTRLNQLLEQLPQVTDRAARLQVESEASQLYAGAGQYELAVAYAKRMQADVSTPSQACQVDYYLLHARYLGGTLKDPEQTFRSSIGRCVTAGEVLFANCIRADLAAFYIDAGRPLDAIRLLQANYADIEQVRYQPLIAQSNALLAQAYYLRGRFGLARQHALAAVASSVRDEYTQTLADGYRLLYRIDLDAGRYRDALAFHEKYMAADKAHLDDLSAKALAYQMVKQQVQAKKAEVDALARRNQILQLQQALDRKAVEASRLYIAVLLLSLLAFGLWLLRLKRSQLRFMRMSQCDGLTGIYNRKHFMAEAGSVLRHAERSGRSACLVLIDLDHFKLTNDTYGHAMGDHVLRRAVAACQAYLRPTDVFGRVGGEEFGVLLVECCIDGGIERAEAMRRAVAGVSDEVEPSIPVSASFGVAFTDESGHELHQLLVDADHALYRAKRVGRNCVVAGKTGEGVVIA